MKRTLFGLIVAASLTVLGAALGACGGGNLSQEDQTQTAQPVAEPVTVTVNLLGNRFDASEVTVPAGSTVIIHNTTSADHGLVSEVFDVDLRPGQDYQHVFNNPGTYTVRSRTHNQAAGISLTVRVE